MTLSDNRYLRSSGEDKTGIPFVVRYPFDTLTVLSNVEGLTTYGK
jgi:hypothetical protein